MTKRYSLTAAALILLLLGGLGYLVMVGQRGDPFAGCRKGEVALGSGSIGGPFTLVNEDRKTVTDKDVIKGPTLIYFGYTFCPDVCPVDNARNAEATDILKKQGYDVTPVFITVDPKRDTPDVVREFTQNFSPRMVGLTGSEAQVKAAAKAYHVYYKVQDPSQEYYLVNHSTYTYLMLPGRGFVDFFRRDTTPESMADTVACFVRAAQGV